MTLNWRDIDTVLLDMDGTLLDLHFDTFFWMQHLPKRYAEQHNMSLEQVAEKLARRMSDFQGTLNWYCTDFWSAEFDLDILALKQEIDHLIGYRPHARSFLEALGTHNKQRVLVTNAHRDSVDLKFALTGIDAHLDSVISSHDYGQPKEDQRFWQQLQENINFDPKRTLFIDDSEPVLRSAEKFGIAHLLSIEEPDSQTARRQPSSFPMLDSFAHLMTSDGLV
jgi:HAD superfamily hydrolase (TIGR01509 family)|tara:strand:- start:4854 stop:5522 length:669 start_codon:yes stop_codon:yes gene_type:complete